MPYLQQTQHAIAAMLPTREQFLWSIDSSLQQAQFGWRTFVNMCYRADWATALPVIAALHGARILLRNISLSLLYYSGTKKKLGRLAPVSVAHMKLPFDVASI